MGAWRTSRRLWRPFAIALGVESVSMLAFSSLRLYYDHSGGAQPRLLEGVLLSFAIVALLVAIVFAIGIVRRLRQ